MLKLRIIQPGQKDLVYEVQGDEAVVGRASGCDVVVPLSYVSKRHAKLMAGIVLVDLGSSNGTHVDGQRVEGPVLLAGRPFHLGGEASDVRFEVEHEGREGDSPAVRRVREDLDAERLRGVALAKELDALRSSAAQAITDPESLPLVVGLRAERQDLQRRLDWMKQELAERDVAGAEALQARLAAEQLERVQERSAELERELSTLRKQAAGPAVQAAKEMLAKRVAELEADHAEDVETIRRTKAELEAAQAAAQPAGNVSELFFKLQRENHELRRQLEERGEVPAGGTTQVHFELLEENKRLKRRVEELERVPAAGGAGPADGEGEGTALDALRRRNHELEMVKADLAAELELLRGKLGSAAPTPLPVSTQAAAAGAVAEHLRLLADEDVEPGEPGATDVEVYLAVEMFRFLRQCERVITRMAGGFIQLLDQRTLLPDVAGNVRTLVGAVLEAPDESLPRQELTAYLDELRRWLVVALGANRRAAERFVEEVRSDLSERSLTASEPIPKYKKLAGLADAELWARVSLYLRKLTADVVEDRLEQLTRACAEEIRREQERA